MSVTAIIVDGSDRLQVGGTIVMPAERVEHRGRAWLAVGVGLLTAVVAFGATGPQRAHVEPSVAPGRGPLPIGLAEHVRVDPPSPPDRHIVWTPWREWVDPATGLIVRSNRDKDELLLLLVPRFAGGHPA
jgi:hypothetical protein